MSTHSNASLPFLKRLREPATFWTDCLLAACSGWLAWSLARSGPTSHAPATLWWIGAFTASAIAAAAGAIHHGLGHELHPSANQRLWQFTLLSLVGTGFCLLQVAAHLALAGPVLLSAQIAAGLVALGFGAAALRIDKFSAAIGAYGLGLTAVTSAAILTRHHYASVHWFWIVAGFGLSVAAAVVQHFRIGCGPRFNHNDLYHVVQLAAQGCFYLGAAAEF